jgi:hypothetical protein
MSTAVGRGADSGQRLKPLYSWGSSQSVRHEVDADIGVASIGPGARAFGAVHVGQQAIFAGGGRRGCSGCTVPVPMPSALPAEGDIPRTQDRLPTAFAAKPEHMCPR